MITRTILIILLHSSSLLLPPAPSDLLPDVLLWRTVRVVRVARNVGCMGRNKGTERMILGEHHVTQHLVSNCLCGGGRGVRGASEQSAFEALVTQVTGILYIIDGIFQYLMLKMLACLHTTCGVRM